MTLSKICLEGYMGVSRVKGAQTMLCRMEITVGEGSRELLGI